MSKTVPTTRPVSDSSIKPRRPKTQTRPNAITKAVGNAIRIQREILGLTQFEVAVRAEVERTRIGKLEGGHVNASVLSLASICNALDITLADLFADIRLSHPPTTDGGELRRANQAVLDKPAKSSPKAKSKSITSGASVTKQVKSQLGKK